jgi:cell division protein FtsL
MAFAIFSMRLLELVFFVGLVGSAVVVVISFVEDGKELFGKD